MRVNMKQTRVSSVPNERLEKAKYINVQFITKDSAGVDSVITFMLGRGDDLYIDQITKVLEAYGLDQNAERMIQIEDFK